MSNDLYEALSTNPEIENCHPVFVARVAGKRCIVATVTDGIVYLTDEGREFLGGVAEKPVKASKKSAKKVESANELASEVDDLDLSE